MRSFFILWGFALSFWATSAQADNKIDVLSYYKAPPFYFSDGSGLVADLLGALEKHGDGLSFSYKVISRPALNRIIPNVSNPLIVPLTNPLWFGDPYRNKYQWSNPLYKDSNTLISHRNDPVDFEGRKTFIAQSVGVPSGFRVYLLDDLVEKELATRMDVSDMSVLVSKVAHKNLRMAVIPFILAHYQVQNNGLEKDIYFSKQAHQTFERFFLLKNMPEDKLKAFNQAIDTMKENGVLDSILEKYGY